MNSSKLAEENVKASLLKKVLNLSALNCCKWSVVSQKLFQSLLNRMELFSKTSHKCTRRRQRFQTSVPWANLLKIKTHFEFISISWNITSPKMVRNSILEG